MGAALDLKHEADRQSRDDAVARRAAEAAAAAGQKQGAGAPANKMGSGPAADKRGKLAPKPSTRPELAGVTFRSHEARSAAEKAKLTAADLGTGGATGITATDVRAAVARRGA